MGMQVGVDDQIHILWPHAQPLQVAQQPAAALQSQSIALSCGELVSVAGAHQDAPLACLDQQAARLHEHAVLGIWFCHPFPQRLGNQAEQPASILPISPVRYGV